MKKLLGIVVLGLLIPNYSFAHHPGNNPTEIWLLCHNIMHFIGDITSLGYAGANVFVFLILQKMTNNHGYRHKLQDFSQSYSCS